MRAVQVSRLAGPDGLELVEIDEPAAGDGVVIDVRAAGVAWPDLLLTRGEYQLKPELPFTPGGEVAGIVRSGPGLSPGTRVAALTYVGGWQETVVVPPSAVVELPDFLPDTVAAGLLFNYLTVHFALCRRTGLAAGETVLVHGATGGVGDAALRLAGALGARTIAVVSTPEKEPVARAAGAHDAVLADGFLGAVRELTGGRGVDIVVDPVGGDRFTDSLRSLAPEGRLLVIGFTGGAIPQVKVNRLLLNNIAVVGVGWGAFMTAHPDYLRHQWDELLELLQSGLLLPPECIAYPAEKARDVLLDMRERRLTGKAVLTFQR